MACAEKTVAANKIEKIAAYLTLPAEVVPWSRGPCQTTLATAPSD